MIATTPLDQAIEAWYRPRDVGREVRIDDARHLLEWGIFSKQQVAKITELPWGVVLDLSDKVDKTGGQLNPETLPMLRDLRASWVKGQRNERLAALIYERGTKRQMIHILTGIPMSTLQRWVVAA